MDTTGSAEYTVPVIKGKVHEMPIIDATLSKSGYSADAKAVGDALKRKTNAVDFEKLVKRVEALEEG